MGKILANRLINVDFYYHLTFLLAGVQLCNRKKKLFSAAFLVHFSHPFSHTERPLLPLFIGVSGFSGVTCSNE